MNLGTTTIKSYLLNFYIYRRHPEKRILLYHNVFIRIIVQMPNKIYFCRIP